MMVQFLSASLSDVIVWIAQVSILCTVMAIFIFALTSFGNTTSYGYYNALANLDDSSNHYFDTFSELFAKFLWFIVDAYLALFLTLSVFMWVFTVVYSFFWVGFVPVVMFGITYYCRNHAREKFMFLHWFFNVIDYFAACFAHVYTTVSDVVGAITSSMNGNSGNGDESEE